MRPKAILLSKSSSINCKAYDLTPQALISSESLTLNLISMSFRTAKYVALSHALDKFFLSCGEKENTFALGLRQEEDEPPLGEQLGAIPCGQKL